MGVAVGVLVGVGVAVGVLVSVGVAVGVLVSVGVAEGLLVGGTQNKRGGVVKLVASDNTVLPKLSRSQSRAQ